MAKKTVESSLALDVLDFAREDRLSDGSRGAHFWQHSDGKERSIGWQVTGGALVLSYALVDHSTSDPTHYSYPVTLAHTPTRFGGVRVWFLCPRCQARVRKLYLPPGGVRFLCRRCHDLSYRSRQRRQPAWEKNMARAEELARTLHDPRTRGRRWLETYKESTEVLATLRASDYLRDLRRPLGALKEKEPEVPPLPVKLPRGRPKLKRPYLRSRPFTESTRASEHEALCLRCREFRELAQPRPVTLPNGRPARKGVCPVCGAGMCEITKGSSL